MRGEIATASAALMAVLAMIWLVARGARRFQGGSRNAAGRDMAVLEVLALDARRRVHLIACQDKRVLLLTGGPADLVLGWMPADDEAKDL